MVLIPVTAFLVSCDADSPEVGDPQSAKTVAGPSKQELTELAELYGVIDPPRVATIAVLPRSEFPAAQVACLQDAGFDASLTPDGEGVQADIASSRNDEYSLAAYTCAVRYRLDPEQDGPLSAEQLEIAHRYLTTTLVQCLKERGYSVEGVPSLETFISTYDTNPWNPYIQIEDQISEGEWKTLAPQCPPNTPAEMLYSN